MDVNARLKHALARGPHRRERELKKAFPDVQIVGPLKRKRRKRRGWKKIPGIDRKVDDGDSVFVGDVELKVMDVPWTHVRALRVSRAVGEEPRSSGHACSPRDADAYSLGHSRADVC